MLTIKDNTEPKYLEPKDMQLGHFYKFEDTQLEKVIIGLVTDKEELNPEEYDYYDTAVAFVDIETGYLYIEHYDEIELVEELDVEMILNKTQNKEEE